VEDVKPFGVVLRIGPGQTGVIPNMRAGSQSDLAIRPMSDPAHTGPD
jgi:hypothetical protein